MVPRWLRKGTTVEVAGRACDGFPGAHYLGVVSQLKSGKRCAITYTEVRLQAQIDCLGRISSGQALLQLFCARLWA